MDLEGLPIEALEDILIQRSDSFVDQVNRMESASAGGQALGAESFDLDPTLVAEVSTILAGVGLLPGPTDTLNPEVVAALQMIADSDAPGLYDLSREPDLLEVMNGVINGTIQVANPADQGIPSGGPGPLGDPGLEPGAGPLGGLPPGAGGPVY